MPTKKSCSKAGERETPLAPQSQRVGSGQPRSLPPELHQSFCKFPKPIKAGTSTFPFLTLARGTHFFPKSSVKSQVGFMLCQGTAGLTSSSRAWEILTCSFHVPLARAPGWPRDPPAPSARRAGLCVLCIPRPDLRNELIPVLTSHHGPWPHKPPLGAALGRRSSLQHPPPHLYLRRPLLEGLTKAALNLSLSKGSTGSPDTDLFFADGQRKV